jgi:hypothetical protein
MSGDTREASVLWNLHLLNLVDVGVICDFLAIDLFSPLFGSCN